jgi:hypothetical protein
MQQRNDRRPAWLALGVAFAISACGGVEESSSLGSLEQTEEKPSDPHDKCDGTGANPGDPIPTCAEKGLACAVVVDKEHLCEDGLVPYWELACGDNEVCCGPVFDDGTGAGEEKPGDPGEEKPSDPSDPSDPGDPGEAGK